MAPAAKLILVTWWMVGAMDQTLIQQQLREGIQAVQRGDRARGRELLLSVVAADETSEPAWLWLSRVVDDPADQLVALENALTLNPANATAHRHACPSTWYRRPQP